MVDLPKHKKKFSFEEDPVSLINGLGTLLILSKHPAATRALLDISKKVCEETGITEQDIVNDLKTVVHFANKLKEKLQKENYPMMGMVRSKDFRNEKKTP